MKKKFLSALLVLILCLAPAMQTVAAAETQPPANQVYSAIIALKTQYPEGMRWTNDNFYSWQGGVYSGGYGCAGFAFLLSDAAFGDLPARMLTSFDYSDVRVGDILRINNDTHSVIVLEVYSDHVVIAEGNYNSSVHWGRSLTQREVMQANNLLTRYSQVQPEPSRDLAYASNQQVDVDGKKMEFQMYALLDAKGNSTNYIRLRDIAHILNGTAAQFAVDYSNTAGITLNTGSSYASNGSEMSSPFAGADKEYTQSDMTFTVNGSSVQLDTITLVDNQGGGYNYIKLRDLGAFLGFNVDWSADRGIFVETDRPYQG